MMTGSGPKLFRGQVVQNIRSGKCKQGMLYAWVLDCHGGDVVIKAVGFSQEGPSAAESHQICILNHHHQRCLDFAQRSEKLTESQQFSVSHV